MKPQITFKKNPFAGIYYQKFKLLIKATGRSLPLADCRVVLPYSFSFWFSWRISRSTNGIFVFISVISHISYLRVLENESQIDHPHVNKSVTNLKHIWMTLVSSVYCSMYDCCQIMVCIPCNTMLWLCHDWRGKLHSLAQAFQSTFEPPPHHLTNRQQRSKLVLQARVTKKGMIALTVKVFYWCTVLQQARQIIGRQGVTLWHYVAYDCFI